MNNFINAPSWHTNVFRQSVLTYAQWFQEFFQQYLTRVNGHGFLGHNIDEGYAGSPTGWIFQGNLLEVM
jgi:hypothetical protein